MSMVIIISALVFLVLLFGFLGLVFYLIRRRSLKKAPAPSATAKEGTQDSA